MGLEKKLCIAPLRELIVRRSKKVPQCKTEGGLKKTDFVGGKGLGGRLRTFLHLTAGKDGGNSAAFILAEKSGVRKTEGANLVQKGKAE